MPPEYKGQKTQWFGPAIETGKYYFQCSVCKESTPPGEQIEPSWIDKHRQSCEKCVFDVMNTKWDLE